MLSIERTAAAMSVFDIAAILITVAAVSGYVNHRLLHFPPTSGTLLVALISSLIVVVLELILFRACSCGPPSSGFWGRSISTRR